MKINKKLAICIPTYNRETYLKELIYSIIADINGSNLQKEVAICISDNCSTDNTKNAIDDIKKQYNDIDITYHQNVENIGPDLNYMKCIEISNTQYCWFIGSDDMLPKDSLNQVFKLISQKEYSVHLFNRIECDIEMNYIKKSNWFKTGKDVFNLSNNTGCIEYFNVCESLGAVFSYLSTIVFNKSEWDKVVYDESYIGTAYVHVYVLLKLLQYNGNYLKIHPYVYPVLSRGENDSFATKGVVKRFELDLNGYEKLAFDLFKNKEDIAKALLKILHREHKITKLFTIRCQLSLPEWKVISKRLDGLYFNKLVTKFLSSIDDQRFTKLYSFLAKIR